MSDDAVADGQRSEVLCVDAVSAGRSGLEYRTREPFRPRREDEDVGPCEVRRHVVNAAGEFDHFAKTQRLNASGDETSPLSIRDLTVAYHRRPVLWDIDYDAPEGSLIGIIGTLLGVVGGILLAQNIAIVVPFFERIFGFSLFPQDIYYITELPSDLRKADVIGFALMSLGMSFLATLYPAWRASRTHPAEALRYE